MFKNEWGEDTSSEYGVEGLVIAMFQGTPEVSNVVFLAGSPLSGQTPSKMYQHDHPRTHRVAVLVLTVTSDVVSQFNEDSGSI